jgi:Flp pilus assembly protein TadG
MKSLMGHKENQRRRAQRCALGSATCDGSVAAEFALVTPLILLIAAGIADFGMLAKKSAALAGTTRIGAAYARLHPAETAGIQSSMQRSTSFMPGLSFPASFPQSCECDDRTSIACTESCATLGRPGPNRVFITISASQAFTPLVPWPGIPASLTAATEIRLQ